MSFPISRIYNKHIINKLAKTFNANGSFSQVKKCATVFAIIALLVSFSSGIVFGAKSDFVVVIDAGHGGKDHGAIDNNAREKDINLAVATRLGELIDKKISNTKVVYTRDDDTFISLQERADIANKAKGNLFISIHTNSVDAKNKNRSTVAGASVYTLGMQKDDANMGVARRENAVIELENGYEQKYSGFDPNKDESYIIFEMAQKNDISRSNRFAKMVQENLVKYAGRKDRGVHQAGFWVLWSTSMPSVLVELDFICNPESAKYLTSKEGVDEMADAIFRAVKIYEQNWRQAERMSQNQKKSSDSDDNMMASAESKSSSQNNNQKVADNKKGGDKKSTKKNSKKKGKSDTDKDNNSVAPEIVGETETIAVAYVPEENNRDMSHSQLKATGNQRKPRSTADGRRRRSSSSRQISESRDVEGEIKVYSEFTGATEKVKTDNTVASASSQSDKDSKSGKKNKKDKKKEDKKKSGKDVKENKNVASADKKSEDKKSKSSKEPSAAMKYKMAKEQEAKEAKKREKENKKAKIDSKSATQTNMATKSNSDSESKSKSKTNTASASEQKENAGKRKSLKSHHND